MAVDPNSPAFRFRRDQFIGWDIKARDTTEGLCIGHLPGRRRFALYRDSPGLCWPLAYFAKCEDAIEAARLIGALAGGIYLPWGGDA